MTAAHKTARWRKCQHLRTPENTLNGGATSYCRMCRTMREERQREMTAARNEQLGDEYMDGASIVDLAARYRIGVYHVRKILKDEGCFGESFDWSFTERALVRAAELVGSSAKELRSPARVRRLVRARWAVMQAMADRGASIVAIGKALERDHSTVLYGLRQADYAARQPDFAQMLRAVGAA